MTSCRNKLHTVDTNCEYELSLGRVESCAAAVNYSLRTTHCALHTTHCTLHTTCCALHTAHCTLHTTHYTLHTARYSLPTTYTLFITHHPPPTTHYLPPTTHYHCQLPLFRLLAEAHFGRYPTARPTLKQLEGKEELEGDFMLFPGGQYRWVHKDEKVPNPFGGGAPAAGGGIGGGGGSGRDDGRQQATVI